VSDEAKDLINKLIIDQESRLSAEEALNHPWIKNMASLPNKKFSEQQYKNLKKFRDSERLKKAVLHYMASQMSAKESHSLDELFMCLDVNGDGRLSVEEFKKGLSGVKSEEEVKSIIEAIDVDQNGYVDYNEFVAATMDASVFLNEKKILHAFNLFDVVILLI
jgi:calcium-dependent protein kinase